jgi:hypothetical protein
MKELYTQSTESIYVFFVWFLEQTEIISLHSINLLVFIIETECVYCTVRKVFLNIIYVNSGLHLEQ